MKIFSNINIFFDIMINKLNNENKNFIITKFGLNNNISNRLFYKDDI